MKTLNSNELRQTWINFFQKHRHLFIPPVSLIPKNDPSLLWINSGVATLKDYFSGRKNPPDKRLVNCQKCIRTNDIENVGVTTRHHTMFEMLGNFSIGDYFKTEAIQFAYDFLTKELDINFDLIYITVFNEDDISYQMWRKLGIEESHIIKNDRERNFWDMGSGPCGPCTEIYYDRGEKYDQNKIGIKLLKDDLENDRYIEIWNIVFSEFNNDGKNNYEPLVRKNIDTGAGLERILSISQNAPTNFDTDLFLPAIERLTKINDIPYQIDAYFSRKKEQSLINQYYRVIVDHLKANLFAIADGEIPSNKERGAILRRLLRRAIVFARKLNFKDEFIKPTIDELVKIYESFYPHLSTAKKQVLDAIQAEYRQFNKTLDKGLQLFFQAIKGKEKLDGETVFSLVDTYGFPFEIIKELSIEHNVLIDEAKYQELIANRAITSRANKKVVAMDKQANDLINFLDQSEFLYDDKTLTANIIAIFDQNFQRMENGAGDCWLAFDKTIFYATSGGQVHDEGYITINDEKLHVIDVMKSTNGQHLHLVKAIKKIQANDQAALAIDETFRKNISRNHTTEHLLEMVLNQNVSKTIKQEGAFKNDQYFTFDFKFDRKLSEQELKTVEAAVNDIIEKDYPITTSLMTYEETKNVPQLVGHFDDTYKQIKGKLRVVKIGDLNVEICGGTHVKSTGEIEQFMISEYLHKSSDMWRIRGLTSYRTIKYYESDQVAQWMKKLTTINEQYAQYQLKEPLYEEQFALVEPARSRNNFAQLKKIYERAYEILIPLFNNYQKNNIGIEIAQIKNSDQEFNSAHTICLLVLKNKENKAIVAALNELANAQSDHCYVAINCLAEKIQYVLVCNKNFSTIKCNEFIKLINEQSGGSGGGNPAYAQGGTNLVDRLPKIIEFIKNYQ